DKKPMWYDPKVAVHFFVGDRPEPFGDDFDRLDGPRYASGFLPIVALAYRQGDGKIEQEVFAPVREPYAARGAVFVRFIARGRANTVAARVPSDERMVKSPTGVCDGQGCGRVLHDAAWQWDGGRHELRARLEADKSCTLTVLTQPLPPPLPSPSVAGYDAERIACVRAWEELFRRGMGLEVPEPVVQNDWGSRVLRQFMIAT